jgi:LysM repeat protein
VSGACVATVAHAESTSIYVVTAGDSVWSIAQRFNVDATRVLRLNGLTAKSLIRPGQRLSIPTSVISAPAQLSDRLPDHMRRASKTDLIPLFNAAARESGIDADLLKALAFIESGWQVSIRSPDGAIGLTQLLPATVRWVGPNLLGESNLRAERPADNLRMAAAYLKWLLQRFDGDTRKALGAYYEGAESVKKRGMSRAARAYAGKIQATRAMFRF